MKQKYLQLQQTLCISSCLLCRIGLQHLTYRRIPFAKSSRRLRGWHCIKLTLSWELISRSPFFPLILLQQMSGFPSARTYFCKGGVQLHSGGSLCHSILEIKAQRTLSDQNITKHFLLSKSLISLLTTSEYLFHKLGQQSSSVLSF